MEIHEFLQGFPFVTPESPFPIAFNKTGTCKVGTISKAQKAQKTFFKKKTFRKCRISAEKCKRGDPLGFINIYSVAKYHKTRKRDSFETLKNFREKIAQCRQN